MRELPPGLGGLSVLVRSGRKFGVAADARIHKRSSGASAFVAIGRLLVFVRSDSPRARRRGDRKAPCAIKRELDFLVTA